MSATTAVRYSPFRRMPELEPHGRWLSQKRRIGWPDTILTERFLEWMPRGLVAATAIAATVSAPAVTGWARYLWVLGVLAILAGWQEFWQRWDLSPMGRRVVAFSVQLALSVVLVILNPIASIIAFGCYTYAATLFTGVRMLGGIVLTAITVAVAQMGGWDQVSSNWALYLTLVGVNAVIATAFITMDSRREDAVAQRDQTLADLIAAQERNSELQQRLVIQARQTGVQDERSRLARELHDTVAQGFVAVVAQLESLQDCDVVTPAGRERIDNAKTLARQGLGEARRAVTALRPAALVDRTVPAAIQVLLAEWAAVHGIDAQLQVSGHPRATSSDATLVRVAQEALANVARHAHATAVTVTLTYFDDEVLLDITDDGAGFDPDRPVIPGASGGHGLVGMTERVSLAGGRLAVESEPGAGTVISAAVPG